MSDKTYLLESSIIIPPFPIMFRLTSYIPTVNSGLLFNQIMRQEPSSPASPPRQYLCGPGYPYHSSISTVFTDTEAHIYVWPSKGGVIILNGADAIDFEFLALNPLDPPTSRLPDQADEDDFCQRLLLLGAKWWDSEARYDIVSVVEDEAQGIQRTGMVFNIQEEPEPTMREKRLVKVAWPSTGGVWIADFDTTWAGVDEVDPLLPDDADVGRLKMARTMDERSVLLRDRFEATFYADVGGFEGYAFFNCWDSKSGGEVGPLLLPHKTRELWRNRYYRKPPMPAGNDL